MINCKTEDAQKSLVLTPRDKGEKTPNGMLPGIIFDKTYRISVFLDKKAIMSLHKSRNLLGCTFVIDPQSKVKLESQYLIVRDISVHASNSEVQHIDLGLFSKGDIVRGWMPVFYYNCDKSPATKQDAVFHILQKKIRIEAESSMFPNKIRFDLGGYDAGMNVKAKDVTDQIMGVKLLRPHPESVISKFVRSRRRAATTS